MDVTELLLQKFGDVGLAARKREILRARRAVYGTVTKVRPVRIEHSALVV